MAVASEPKRSWFAGALTALGMTKKLTAEVDQQGFGFQDALTLASLMGNGVQDARSRQHIYQKYQQMMTDPVVSGALRIHVQAALGGDPATGDVIFIEPTSEARKDKRLERMVKEIAEHIGPIANAHAMPVAYNGIGFGDGYGRLYTGRRKGVTDICSNEMMLPPLIQPYERGNDTKVCVVAIGHKGREKLLMNQIARMKMPRTIYSPQPLAVEKAWRTLVLEDDVDKVPLMPALAGGSFLADAEHQYNNFMAAMQGLVGQRVLDSIDESIFTLQVQGMTVEQKQKAQTTLAQILQTSKRVADEAVRTGKPFLGRIRHVVPVFGEKQLVAIQGLSSSGGGGSGRAANVSIEDVVFHAKLLCGALGVDLTMLGFADQMSGGLGEGGFLRTSVQSAERSKCIREALSGWLNHVIDVHCVYRYGMAFPANKRPWQINYYGTIAAMEKERQQTELDSANAGLVLLQMFEQLKSSGLEVTAIQHFLTKVANMSDADAKLYAAAIIKARDAANDDEPGTPTGDDLED